MEQTPVQEQVQLPPSQETQSTKSSTSIRSVLSIAAAVLKASFFMPWASFFGGYISGLDIQKNVDSYRLVWILPASGLVALVSSLAKVPEGFPRRMAGLVPVVILGYSLNKYWGGWIALASEIVLIVIPSPFKPQAKA